MLLLGRFKVITADPWNEKVLSITTTPNDDQEPSAMCERLRDSPVFGSASLQCGPPKTDASLFSMSLDTKVLQGGGSEATCKKDLSDELKKILTLSGEEVFETRSATAPLKYEATFSRDPIYGLPNGCVNLQEKTMKVTKLGVVFQLPDLPSNILDSMAPLVTLLANVTSNAKLFQADYHLSFHKSEMINVFFSFYEQQETQEFRHLWKFLSTLIRIGLKYETRFLFVPKITERTEQCTVIERGIPVIALTLRLSSPKVDNQILLKLGEQDQQAYNTILDKVYADLTTIMRQSGLVTAVWSFSLDALETDVESHTAWIYIKLDLNKMPSDFSQTSLQSRPLEAYISGKVNAVTGLSPTSAHVHRAVLTQSRIGCTYMGRKLTPEQITPAV
ncbi:hypothetical protein CSKR_107889 [Clonorchis sinensis]|uniref:Uncharacterized protein n=1 Tax=Clonorchis sinensis TaxID=79923 RepID=A0A8T1MQ10_CLOSI|nr:hypothetical protein CSKR_107889 [Clonorchis sinensis]